MKVTKKSQLDNPEVQPGKYPSLTGDNVVSSWKNHLRPKRQVEKHDMKELGNIT